MDNMYFKKDIIKKVFKNYLEFRKVNKNKQHNILIKVFKITIYLMVFFLLNNLLPFF